MSSKEQNDTIDFFIRLGKAVEGLKDRERAIGAETFMRGFITGFDAAKKKFSPNVLSACPKCGGTEYCTDDCKDGGDDMRATEENSDPSADDPLFGSCPDIPDTERESKVTDPMADGDVKSADPPPILWHPPILWTDEEIWWARCNRNPPSGGYPE